MKVAGIEHPAEKLFEELEEKMRELGITITIISNQITVDFDGAKHSFAIYDFDSQCYSSTIPRMTDGEKLAFLN